jgi:hypothetical protein
VDRCVVAAPVCYRRSIFESIYSVILAKERETPSSFLRCLSYSEHMA